MLQAIALILFGLMALMGTSHAAVLITIDDHGKTATDVFDNQVYYHLENGNLAMRMDLKANLCSMFIHDQRVHVEGKCDEAQKEMEAAMSEMFKQQGMSREDMVAMRQMMERQRPPGADIKPVGAETIAGYEAECYELNASRKMCFSKAVTALIDREFSFNTMLGLRDQWNGGPFRPKPSEAEQAERKLRSKGYVMKDIDLKSGMPNAEALRMLPEAVRQHMMAQFKQSGGKATGSIVVRIEKQAAFTPEVPDYPKKSIREFAHLLMRQ